MQAKAFSPAGVGNVGVGFDVLGHAFAAAGDVVAATRVDNGGVRVTAITGIVKNLPIDPEKNTASVAVAALLKAQGASFGVELQIEKGIPLGSGMGGSAASAVAALVAANALLDKPLALIDLYPYALEGECVASGGYHGDNVGPQLLGGLVLALHDQLVPIPVPENIYCALAHPHQILETRLSRLALTKPFQISTIVEQSSYLSCFIAGCYRGDLDLIRKGLRDVLVEPRRSALIPGFAQVKQAALDCGALGASISGGGPSVFAWVEGQAQAEETAEAMVQAFDAQGIQADGMISRVATAGARIIL